MEGNVYCRCWCRVRVENHRVVWCHSSRFQSKMSAPLQTGVLEPSLIRVSVRKVQTEILLALLRNGRSCCSGSNVQLVSINWVPEVIVTCWVKLARVEKVQVFCTRLLWSPEVLTEVTPSLSKLTCLHAWNCVRVFVTIRPQTVNYDPCCPST